MTACSSDPQWVDEEAHENTEQLRELYTPIIVGTWHVEYIKDKGRFFERLTFSADGTFMGMRKWQTRELVTIDGEEQYTDWQDFMDYNGTFTGKWKLSWERDADGAPGVNRLSLSASYDDERDWMSANALPMPTVLTPSSSMPTKPRSVSLAALFPTVSTARPFTLAATPSRISE